jgi:hypothetical protein
MIGSHFVGRPSQVIRLPKSMLSAIEDYPLAAERTWLDALDTDLSE